MHTAISKYLLNVDGYKLMLEAPRQNPAQAAAHLLNLSYSEAPVFFEAEGFTLRKAKSDHKKYHLLFEILHNGHILGHLYSAPTKNYGPTKSLRPLHLSNAALYTMDFARLLPSLMAAFDFRLHNHSFLHICLFTQECDPAKLIQLAEQFPDKYINTKRTEIDTISGIGGRRKEKVVTTYINKDSSRVKGVIYNKLEELLQLKKGKQKPYILDWFAANGFDTLQPVYSFELKISAKALTVYKALAVTEDGEELSAYHANNNASRKTTRLSQKTTTHLDINKLQNPAYLASLFQKFLPIDIRKKDKSRASNCTKVPLIDFGVYGPDQIHQPVSVSITLPTREKGIINHLMRSYSESRASSYLHASLHVALEFQLVPYLIKLVTEKQIPWGTVEAARPTLLKGDEQRFIKEIRADFNRLLHLKHEAVRDLNPHASQSPLT